MEDTRFPTETGTTLSSSSPLESSKFTLEQEVKSGMVPKDCGFAGDDGAARESLKIAS